MRCLLETHVLLWWLADDPKLAEAHRSRITDGANEIYVSSITVAEISIKASLGKLDAPAGVPEAIRQSGMRSLPFTASHAEELRKLPWLHRDPFDRMLIAQARIEDLELLTIDDQVRRYDVRTT